MRELIDATQQQVGQPGVVEMPSNAEPRLDKPDIQVVDGLHFADKAEELIFMEEPVVIVIHTTSDKFAENPVPLGNGGRRMFVPRGTNVVIARKYVEVLARAKVDQFGDQEYIDNDGIRHHRYPKGVNLQYPFSVVEDKNPKGKAWLQKVLAEQN